MNVYIVGAQSVFIHSTSENELLSCFHNGLCKTILQVSPRFLKTRIATFVWQFCSTDHHVFLSVGRGQILPVNF